ncbi:ketopantoate reductase C-terminal domain-containing protein [Sulfitobacter sp. JB4-11]|uniref:ketopantoate reductase C-terminal domain-containing protein n=1 Tax=Sulfitobacter rhodophyticola TaxID=3238304 RepID=UPI003516F6A9
MRPHIVIAGGRGSAGARAAFLAGLYALEGFRVTLWTTGAALAELRGHGLTLTDHAGMAQAVPADRVDVTDDPLCIAQADILFLSTRVADGLSFATGVEELLRRRTVVISLQTGVPQQDILAGSLLGCDLRGAMLDFDVLALGQGCFYRTSAGPMIIGAGPGDLATKLNLPALEVRHSREVDALQWGRFLVDLMGTINALSGLRLRMQMLDRGWRRLMADQWAEALEVLQAHGLHPLLTTTPRPPTSLPRLLRLPTPVFRHVADDVLPHASALRSPVAQDLMQGVATEGEALQGALIDLGAAREVPTPMAEMLWDVLQSAELAGQGLPDLPVRALRRELAAQERR